MSKSLAADYSLGSEDLADALKGLVAANRPAMVWGAPGIGKSDIAKQVAADMKLSYIDVRALLLDPVDLRGIPWRDAGRTRWAPPVFLPPEDSTEGYLVNFEELPSALPAVQTALYQLVFDRQIGEYRLPPGARMIACGNRETDRGVVHRMPTPLASRFVHLDAWIDVKAWVDWALSANLPMEVVTFIKYKPELLMTFDPKAKEKAFGCPRTWSFVGDLVKAGNAGKTETELAVLRGTVGEGPAIEFAAFMEVFRQLPPLEAVFADPHGVNVPTKPDALIALCGAVAAATDDAKMDAAVTFARRLRPEIGEFMINAACRRDPENRYTQAFNVWVAYLESLQ